MELNKINKKCRQCSKKCKQTTGSIILHCANFRKKARAGKVVDLIENKAVTTA